MKRKTLELYMVRIGDNFTVVRATGPGEARTLTGAYYPDAVFDDMGVTRLADDGEPGVLLYGFAPRAAMYHGTVGEPLSGVGG